MGDYISRAEAIKTFHKKCDKEGMLGRYDIQWTLEALPSADAVPQSEQYKKGFEDAKRAFELEYARESENMRKRNAKLEVMLNAQKAISADAEWIPCSEKLPEKEELVLVTVWNDVVIAWRNRYGGWESAEDMYEKGDVIAWMPLPKPYREESEVGE